MDQFSARNRDVTVIAVPCVGNETYLLDQMNKLDTMCGDEKSKGFPVILSTRLAPKRVFAQPYAEHLQIWQDIKCQTNIIFDLIYTPRVFEVMFSQGVEQNICSKSSNFSLEHFMPDSNIIYYHCGGIEGNESQLLRYKHKKLNTM